MRSKYSIINLPPQKTCQKFAHFELWWAPDLVINIFWRDRSSHQEVFLRKSVLKIFSEFTGEHPCRSVISIKWSSNFIEITLWHECSPVNLLHIFRTPFPMNTSGRLRLQIYLDRHKLITCIYFRSSQPPFSLKEQLLLPYSGKLWQIKMTKLVTNNLTYSSNTFLGLLLGRHLLLSFIV